MDKRLAMTIDNRLTFCTSSPENMGKGRCNHISHQDMGEAKEDFLKRASLFLSGDSNKGNNSFIEGKDKYKGNRKPKKPGNKFLVAAAIISLGLSFMEETPDLSSFIDSAKTEVLSKLNLHDETKAKEVSGPKDNTEIRKEIDILEAGIEIQPREDIAYDRDSWGEYEEYFEYEIDGEIYGTSSTRKAAIYKSEWYDPELEVYTDPYTGNEITDFDRWSGSGALQFDHIIPLSYVASQIGDEWTSEEKSEYSYDLDIGVNADASLNGAKSDKGPSGFLPPENKEEYCYSWLVIANEYDIPITQEDMDVIMDVLDNAEPEEIKIINNYDK